MLVQNMVAETDDTEGDWVLLCAPSKMMQSHFWYNKRTLGWQGKAVGYH